MCLLAAAVDRTPPVFAAYADVVVEATATAQSVPFAKPTATDNLGGDVAIECIPASSVSVTGVENKTVSCTARDASGNPATLTFTVAASE
jgi:hypothetical protein